jgi:hypothetical protein
MRFNFSACGDALGGCLELECHPQQGWAELAVTLYLPGGRILSLHEKSALENGDPLAAGGCRIEVLEPGRRLRTRFDGVAIETGRRRARRRRVEIDLEHEAAGPGYGGAADACQARARYKQPVRVRGTVRVAGQEFRVDGRGRCEQCRGARLVGAPATNAQPA